MDHRTGTGLFKKIMWYEKSVGYGNDILKKPVGPWTKEREARYSAFVRRFTPRSNSTLQ